jgi:hypothetical protein
MNILHTEWWNIAVPPEWWADQEEESILIGDRDDVGSVEISTLHRDSGQFDAGEVLAIARENADQDCQWQEVTVGDFKGVYTTYTDEGSAIREWYLAAGAILLFMTYCCEAENGGMDDAAVDEILDTLQTADPD